MLLELAPYSAELPSAEQSIEVASRGLSDPIGDARLGEPMCEGSQSLVSGRCSSIGIALRLILQPANSPLDRSEFALISEQSGLIEV